MVNCSICSKAITTRGARKYCSFVCRNIGMVKNPQTRIVECVICSRIVEKNFRASRNDSKLCSMSCTGEFNRRRITGQKNESLYEIVQCKSCGVDVEKLKSRTKKEFCSRSCRTKWTTPNKYRSKKHSYLLDGYDILFRSRWEAVFVKDYLDKNKLSWEYESQTFVLSNGSKYTPDFYIRDTDTFVEVKGNRINNVWKVDALRLMGHNILLADHSVLKEKFGLNLDHSYLSQITKKPIVRVT